MLVSYDSWGISSLSLVVFWMSIRICRSKFTCSGLQVSPSKPANIAGQETSVLEKAACRWSSETSAKRLPVQRPRWGQFHCWQSLLGGHCTGETLLASGSDHWASWQRRATKWELLQPGCEQHIVVHLPRRWTVPGMPWHRGEAAVSGEESPKAGHYGEPPEGRAGLLRRRCHDPAPLLLCAVHPASVPHVKPMHWCEWTKHTAAHHVLD